MKLLVLIPDAIKRTLGPTDNLFVAEEGRKAIEYLRQQLPPVFFDNPLHDNPVVDSVPASKQLLPQMFEAAGRPMEKCDFFLIAGNMKPDEIHPEVIEVLDMIAALLPPDSVDDDPPLHHDHDAELPSTQLNQ